MLASSGRPEATIMAVLLRQTIIGRLRRRLEQRGSPRLLMSVLVALTGCAGFLCSAALLHAGVTELWWRYLLSVGAAYLTFLISLWLWMRLSAPSYIDARDLMGLTREDQSWDDAWRERRSRRDASLEDVLDGDLEAVLLWLAIVLLGTVLSACFYIIYAAPVLFAELMLDGVLSATLYSRLRTLDARHWLETALRRTYKMFMAAATIMAGLGIAMAEYAPGARSIGEVVSRLLS
jgi:hypothetical protein